MAGFRVPNRLLFTSLWFTWLPGVALALYLAARQPPDDLELAGISATGELVFTVSYPRASASARWDRFYYDREVRRNTLLLVDPETGQRRMFSFFTEKEVLPENFSWDTIYLSLKGPHRLACYVQNATVSPGGGYAVLWHGQQLALIDLRRLEVVGIRTIEQESDPGAGKRMKHTGFTSGYDTATIIPDFIRFASGDRYVIIGEQAKYPTNCYTGIYRLPSLQRIENRKELSWYEAEFWEADVYGLWTHRYMYLKQKWVERDGEFDPLSPPAEDQTAASESHSDRPAHASHFSIVDIDATGRYTIVLAPLSGYYLIDRRERQARRVLLDEKPFTLGDCFEGRPVRAGFIPGESRIWLLGDGNLEIRTADGMSVIRFIDLPFRLWRSIRFAPGGKAVAVENGSSVFIWDVQSGTPLHLVSLPDLLLPIQRAHRRNQWGACGLALLWMAGWLMGRWRSREAVVTSGNLLLASTLLAWGCYWQMVFREHWLYPNPIGNPLIIGVCLPVVVGGYWLFLGRSRCGWRMSVAIIGATWYCWALHGAHGVVLIFALQQPLLWAMTTAAVVVFVFALPRIICCYVRRDIARRKGASMLPSAQRRWQFGLLDIVLLFVAIAAASVIIRGTLVYRSLLDFTAQAIK